MQYSLVAVLALAAGANAWYNDTIVWTTEVVDTYVTVCPASATITYNGHTYTNTLTESSTITVTNCPCTVSKPVYTTSSVYCNTCAPSVPAVSAPSAPAVSSPSGPVIPTYAPSAPIYPNATTPAPVVPTSAPGGSVGTTSVAASGTPSPSVVPASGANKAFAMSGASLAGLLGLAAYLL